MILSRSRLHRRIYSSPVARFCICKRYCFTDCTPKRIPRYLISPAYSPRRLQRRQNPTPDALTTPSDKRLWRCPRNWFQADSLRYRQQFYNLSPVPLPPRRATARNPRSSWHQRWWQARIRWQYCSVTLWGLTRRCWLPSYLINESI